MRYRVTHRSAAAQPGLTQVLGAMKYISIVLLAFLYASSGTLCAEDLSPPSPNSKIFSVLSGGRWQTDDMQGTYRIILWAEGFEHVSTGVVAEWLADSPGEGTNPKLIHSEILVSPGMNSFGKPTLIQTKNGYTVVLVGVNTYDTEQKISCKFELRKNMTVKATIPCG